jgi:hypothetical protein
MERIGCILGGRCKQLRHSGGIVSTRAQVPRCVGRAYLILREAFLSEIDAYPQFRACLRH